MDKLKSLQTDLETARKDFRTLQDELPQFHALLTDNEQDAAKLRRERASLDDQAHAKNRVMVAREMLEQHQSDIATARGEIDRLEVLAAREHTISTMADAAKRGKQQRQVLESAMAAANAALLKNLEKVDGAWAGMIQARSDFLNAGGTLTDAFRFTDTPTIWSAEKQAAEIAAGEAVLSELTSQGTDLQDVLHTIANEDRRQSIFDRYTGRDMEIPKPFGPMLHDAVQAYRKHKFNLNKDRPGGDHG